MIYFLRDRHTGDRPVTGGYIETENALDVDVRWPNNRLTGRQQASAAMMSETSTEGRRFTGSQMVHLCWFPLPGTCGGAPGVHDSPEQRLRASCNPTMGTRPYSGKTSHPLSLHSCPYGVPRGWGVRRARSEEQADGRIPVPVRLSVPTLAASAVNRPYSGMRDVGGGEWSRTFA